ncbi:hypothetical protein C8J57DRAFT_1227741 [Mycena rebaudengoi]|nr:hypothetical protein C8J57DRAFT_1227741 [Mycena rebaudengoi]
MPLCVSELHSFLDHAHTQPFGRARLGVDFVRPLQWHHPTAYLVPGSPPSVFYSVIFGQAAASIVDSDPTLRLECTESSGLAMATEFMQQRLSSVHAAIERDEADPTLARLQSSLCTNPDQQLGPFESYLDVGVKDCPDAESLPTRLPPALATLFAFVFDNFLFATSFASPMFTSQLASCTYSLWMVVGCFFFFLHRSSTSEPPIGGQKEISAQIPIFGDLDPRTIYIVF